MSQLLVHEPDNGRYVLNLDGKTVATADYVLQDRSILFTHTFTDPIHRGEGLAGALVSFAIDDVEKNSSARVVPMCSYVEEWFRSHQERSALLAR